MKGLHNLHQYTKEPVAGGTSASCGQSGVQ